MEDSTSPKRPLPEAPRRKIGWGAARRLAGGARSRPNLRGGRTALVGSARWTSSGAPPAPRADVRECTLGAIGEKYTVARVPPRSRRYSPRATVRRGRAPSARRGGCLGPPPTALPGVLDSQSDEFSSLRGIGTQGSAAVSEEVSLRRFEATAERRKGAGAFDYFRSEPAYVHSRVITRWVASNKDRPLDR